MACGGLGLKAGLQDRANFKSGTLGIKARAGGFPPVGRRGKIGFTIGVLKVFRKDNGVILD
jgi:hypothetical protein